MELTPSELPALYREIQKLHSAHLAKLGIRLPSLRRGASFTKDAIVLCALFKYRGQPVSKAALTNIVRSFDASVNDVQQARHLARQKGFYIVSGTRGDTSVTLESGAALRLTANDYCLVTLEKPYPGYAGMDGHRSARGGANFQEIKRNYGNRCATCGSEEGKPNFLNAGCVTTLQAGHMDPTKPLDEANTIPQCSECNRAYRDWFIFDGNGRVTDINMASARWQRKYQLRGLL
jgi:hypothetical protein